MDYNSVIDYIEDEKFLLTDEVYYHAFSYEQKKFINMINEGIKCPILLGMESIGSNGYFYISLSKKEKCEISAYNKLAHLPMFIISNRIKTIKPKNFRNCIFYPELIKLSPLPFRQCRYDDEYQKFLIVFPNDILAIQYNFDYQNKNIEDDLLTLKSIVEDLYSQKICLSIIDTIHCKKVNQEKVLSLKI